MKVTVTKKEVPEVVFIGTDYIKLQDAMKLANTAAGIVVAKVGTATVTAKDLKNALSRHEI